MAVNKTNGHKIRALLILLVLGGGFLACLFRIGWLQLVLGEELTARANANKNILREIQSPRGTIYDRDGRELAVSLISLSFYVDPLAMDDSKEFQERNGKRDVRRLAAGLLASELGRDEKELLELFTLDRHFVWLERTMDKRRTDKIAALLKENLLNGFGFIKESKRYYPMGGVAAQVLGFVGTDDRGLGGIEMTLDSMLKSAVLPQFLETDIAGRPIFSSVLASDRARDMASVYLTIDGSLQYMAERALAAAVRDTAAKGGAALVMDVHNGEIIAMAGYPAFDPNYFYNYDPKNWGNANISTIYEPGSTLKPLIAAMAINEGLIEPETMVYDYGKIKVDDREIINSEERSYGRIPFSEVITRSVNTCMVEIALRLGKERLNTYTKNFGLGKYTDIDLPGEEQGILFNTEDMRPIDMASMSIGQGVAVTPLQLVCAVGALANGGIPIRPVIIKKIAQPDGSPKDLPETKPVKPVISVETSKKVLSMMENVVLRGGGTLAQIPGYRVAGKTGTAEKIKTGGGYASNEYIASFIGIAPAENPRLIALVLLDTPHSSYYGSQVAAPVFKEIMQQALVIGGVKPSAGTDILPGDTPQEGANTLRKGAPLVVGGHAVVPDLTGLTMRECANILQQGKLAFLPRGSGIAARQEPAALSLAPRDSVITVWFE